MSTLSPKPQAGPPDMDWKAECQYISDQTDMATRGRTSLAFNRDPSCLLRYVKMQRDTAARQGKYDVEAYIQHCVDDLSIYG